MGKGGLGHLPPVGGTQLTMEGVCRRPAPASPAGVAAMYCWRARCRVIHGPATSQAETMKSTSLCPAVHPVGGESRGGAAAEGGGQVTHGAAVCRDPSWSNGLQRAAEVPTTTANPLPPAPATRPAAAEASSSWPEKPIACAAVGASARAATRPRGSSARLRSEQGGKTRPLLGSRRAKRRFAASRHDNLTYARCCARYT